MSIRVMNRVWGKSRQAGGPLLVLLAIADNADDDGRAHPKMEKLAVKARLSVRQTQRAIKKLEREGELKVEIGVGPYGANAFQVLTPVAKGGDILSPRQDDGEGDILSPGGVTFLAAEATTDVTPGGDISGDPPTPPYKVDPSEETSLDPSTKNSDAIASGAEAPFDSPKLPGLAVPKTAKDPEDFRIWNLGVKALRGTFSRDEQARSFLGLQVKQYGKSMVAEAVVEMLAQEPVNPKEYLVKTLEGLSSRARGPQAPIRTPTAAEVEQNTAEAERALKHQRRFALACQGLELAMKTEGLNFHDAIARLVEWGIENEPVSEDFVWNVTRHREFANQPDISLAEFFPEAA